MRVEQASSKAAKRADGPPKLAWRSGGLFVVGETGEVPASARRCFPWSEPERYVSIRDEKDEELALVCDLAELDPRSREAVEYSLDEASFVMDIERVDSIEEEFEIRNWRVVTRQGPRTFQTRRDEWPREMPHGGVFIRDVAGDLYRVADPEALDEPSRRRLGALVG